MVFPVLKINFDLRDLVNAAVVFAEYGIAREGDYSRDGKGKPTLRLGKGIAEDSGGEELPCCDGTPIKYQGICLLALLTILKKIEAVEIETSLVPSVGNSRYKLYSKSETEALTALMSKSAELDCTTPKLI